MNWRYLCVYVCVCAHALLHSVCLLRFQKMVGQLSLLNMACAAKARQRSVTLTRASREEVLHFSILGGLERNHGIFIAKVQPGTKAAEAGLKRGDQVRLHIRSAFPSLFLYCNCKPAMICDLRLKISSGRCPTTLNQQW